MFCLCLRLLLCLSVSGCLCICLCRCPCVYLTALLSVPLSLPLSLSVTVPAPVSAHAAAAPGDGTYHVLPAPLLCFHWPVWFPPFSTCRRHPECPRRSRWEIPTFSVQASFETGNAPKRVPIRSRNGAATPARGPAETSWTPVGRLWNLWGRLGLSSVLFSPPRFSAPLLALSFTSPVGVLTQTRVGA